MDLNKRFAREEPTVAEARPGTTPPRRILVVDDEPSIRALNVAVLVRSGYEVDAAENGAVAWDILQRNRYDLVVTDNSMPVVSGIELMEKVQAARMTLPVIMATGTLPLRESFSKAGFQPAALLYKPYTMEELVGTVREVLRTCEPGSGQGGPSGP
jgi:two-component system phosphate regulon response regulator OmpR